MAIDLPAPLTPPCCDIRGYEYMPFFGQRYFGSELYSLALQNPRAGLAAQKLWWEAWQQCPAASLPSDDVSLARLADFGGDLRAWKRVRSVALRGFVACSDGRLYHPLLATAALAVYTKRRKARQRKADQREHEALETNDLPPPVPRDVPRDVTQDDSVTSRVCPAGRHASVPCTSESEGKGKGKEERCTPSHAGAREVPLMVNPLSDPPEAWAPVADRWEAGQDGISHPVVAGDYVDVQAERLARAARVFRTDWLPLIVWLRAGLDFDRHILPAIRRIAARPGYKPPRFLSYFDAAVHDAQQESAA